MSPTDWMVAVGGAVLIAFELWFFLAPRSGRGSS
jgi:hypothetical protein